MNSRQVSISTDLPIDPRRAFELAQTARLFLYVTRGPMRFTGLPKDIAFGRGAKFSARVWLLGFVPAWKHFGEVVDFCDTPPAYEIKTEEHGGPLRAWNHTLTFEQRHGGGTRYTDTVEVEAGPLTRPTVWYAKAFFRYRQHRWRKLAKHLAAND